MGQSWSVVQVLGSTGPLELIHKMISPQAGGQDEFPPKNGRAWMSFGA